MTFEKFINALFQLAVNSLVLGAFAMVATDEVGVKVNGRHPGFLACFMVSLVILELVGDIKGLHS